MAKRKRFVNVLVGVFVGVSVSFLVNYVRTDNMCLPPANTVRRKTVDPLALIGVDSPQNNDEHLLFTGVMTAADYLETRAKTVYDTWGRNVPGRIAFFSSESSYSDSIPLVPLSGVDDSYPPQKKSFAMLKYMHDHYIDRFEWFMRADDDVYVRTDRLEKLLRSVDSRKPWFIGQPGRGNSEEFGLLALENQENYCMGGPGVILSRETLRKIAPYLDECLKNVYSAHEDVEIGRCVKKYAGISCTWSYEMQVILYHNQSGLAAFTGNLKQKEVHKAITLHPVKRPTYMNRLHNYVQGLKVQALGQETIHLHRDISSSMNELGIPIEALPDIELVEDMPLFEKSVGSEDYLGDPTILGVPPSYHRYKSFNLGDVLDWEYVNKTVFSYRDLNPRRRIPTPMKEGIEDVVREAMEIINQYSKQRGRVIDYKDIYYAYWRLDPVYGVDLVMDLLLVYRKYRGHKMTVTVRRHAYIQQTFTGIEIREVDVNQAYKDSTTDENLPFHERIFKRISKISEDLQLPDIFDAHHNTIKKKNINFILPLSGRFKTFKRFMEFYEEICMKENELTRLVIALYKEDQAEYDDTLSLIQDIQLKYKNYEFKIVEMNGTFARGRALQSAAQQLRDDDLMFFVDVDMAFNSKSLVRIRQNTVQNKSVYFPIVYSMYDPKIFGKTYDSEDIQLYEKELLLDENNGAWRQFGFGLVSLYKSDFVKLGGFNTTIVGWGMEDVTFYDGAVTSLLKVIRSVDPGLVHVYHPVHCDSNLDSNQMTMCFGSQASIFGSVNDLQTYFLNNRDHLLN